MFLFSDVTNESYKSIVDRIRAGIGEVFAERFDFKAGFLWPVDWRPREFNKPPDFLSNAAMDARVSSRMDCDWPHVFAALSQGACLQIHCDGGLRQESNIGAAAYVAHLVQPGTDTLTRVSWEVIFLESIASSFLAECIALEHAIQFARHACGYSANSRVTFCMNYS